MSRVAIYTARLTLAFVFAQLNFLGLFAYRVDYNSHRASTSRFKLAYCALAGLGSILMYATVLRHLLGNNTLLAYYSGVSYGAIFLSDIFSCVLIVTFYAYQIVYRKRLIAFLNDLNDAYATFGLFYSVQRLHFTSLDLHYPENMREIDHVYRPLFVKGIVCHSLVLACMLAMAYLLHLGYPTSSLTMFMFFFGFPYTLQSATSSYMLLGLRKLSFLYVEMTRKFSAIYEEVKGLAQDQQMSQFRKMERFCELSDQVDSLAISYDRVTRITMTYSEHYHVHMLLILAFSVANLLTLFFLQYVGLSYLQESSHPFDLRISIAAIVFIIVDIFEILLIINSVENAERWSFKVQKQVQLINYWQKGFDCRLKQSVSKYV